MPVKSREEEEEEEEEEGGEISSSWAHSIPRGCNNSQGDGGRLL